eukprot:363606-Chlamydomonas_euryale.AAC.8
MTEKTDKRVFVRSGTHVLRRRPINCVKSTPCGANAALRNPQHHWRQPQRFTCAYSTYCTRRARTYSMPETPSTHASFNPAAICCAMRCHHTTHGGGAPSHMACVQPCAPLRGCFAAWGQRVVHATCCEWVAHAAWGQQVVHATCGEWVVHAAWGQLVGHATC